MLNIWDYEFREGEKIKLKPIILLAILLINCFSLANELSIKAQTSPNIVNIPLSFHGYSLLLRDPNGSFCVYDGADGAQPELADSVQANLIAQISGQQGGWSYWSAVAMWMVKLQSDLHVVGTVNMRVYISSNFKLSGFFSGGGYGMGLVDVDENNNQVQQFITQGPESIGTNPFTATPTQYSLNTNIDYIFKAGHSIGFAVGLGATTQGFTATVYFGSTDKNSGATLPVEDTAYSQCFTVDYNGASQNVMVVSNSAISNCQFNSVPNSIQFLAQGINYTTGYCNVMIPKTLMQTPLTVTSGTQVITSTLTENSTHYQLYFTHIRDSNPIRITGAATTSPTSPTASPSTSPTTGPSTSSTTLPSTSPANSPSVSPETTPTPPPIPEYRFLGILAVFAVATAFLLTLKKRRSTSKIPR